MSKLMLALTALTFGLSGTTAAQVPYGSAAHTAEVGGVEIQRGGSHDERWSWIPGHGMRRPAGGLVSAGHPLL